MLFRSGAGFGLVEGGVDAPVLANDLEQTLHIGGVPKHEAIIPKDIFLRVQEELARRRVVKTSANGKKRSYSCNHCFAQIVICGECGEMFRRIH